MAKVYGRVHRLLRSLTLIRSGRWNAASLARELGITVRNVYRDLQMLEGAGIPYYFDRTAGCYRIRREFFLPSVELTTEEAMALVAAAGQIGRREQIPFLEPLEKASQKVLAQLPDKVKRELDDVQQHLAIELASCGPSLEVRSVYHDVRTAIAKRRALLCSYESARTSVHSTTDGEVFRFDPYCLYWGQRAWYAIGFHHRRAEVRTLKLNRFIYLRLTDQPRTATADATMCENMRFSLGETRQIILMKEVFHGTNG
ncbi:MAG TPA: WYL domain-containing protein [Phycisphaerae bacterium]|nr:WYL domain-containing protein [Phycisphaerae bacterium]